MRQLRKYRNETRLYNGRFVDRGSQLSIPSSEGDTEGIGQSNTRSVRFKVNRAIFEYLFQANLPDSATAFHQFMQFDVGAPFEGSDSLILVGRFGTVFRDGADQN